MPAGRQPGMFSAPGPLPAAHGQNHRIGADLHESRFPARHRQHPVPGQVQHHGVQQIRNLQLPDLVREPPGVFRPGKLLGKGVQAEARVDALVQNTAQLPVPLEDQQILHPGPPGGDGGGQARRASADNGKLYVFHHASSLVRPVSSRDAPPFFVSSVWGIPSSRARISMTRGVQKPPWHRPIPARTRRFTPSRDRARGPGGWRPRSPPR